MQVAQNTTVVMDYILKDDEGNIIDSTKGGKPLSYIHGVGSIIPGLEKALDGKKSGEKVNVSIPPSEAYGEHNPELLQEVPRSEFVGIDTLEVGMQFQSQSPHGHYQIVTITKVDGDEVTIDTNHPLAGMNLNFDITIVDVKETPESELHSCGCESQGSCGTHSGDHACGCDEHEGCK